jgi:hypothetical protein
VAVVDYFRDYAPRRDVAGAFHGPVVDRGGQVAALVRQGATYVSPGLWTMSGVRFLNATAPPGVFDAGSGHVLPHAGEARYVFDRSEDVAASAFATRWPAFRRVDEVDRWGEPSVTHFVIPPGWSPPVPSTPQVTFGDRISLIGAAVDPTTVAPGESVTLTLLWRVEAPTAVDHNLFVHAVAADGRTVAQFDGPPLGGSYPTDRWRPGERILTAIPLSLNADLTPGPIALRTGWYDWRDGRRLDVPTDDDGAVEVGTISLTAAASG